MLYIFCLLLALTAINSAVCDSDVFQAAVNNPMQTWRFNTDLGASSILTFQADGTISGSLTADETYWKTQNGQLAFLALGRTVTTWFTHVYKNGLGKWHASGVILSSSTQVKNYIAQI